MIRINLLPHREEKRKARRQQFYALLVSVLVLGAVIWFAGYTWMNQRISTQVERNEFLKGEIASLEKEIKEIQQLKQQTDALLARKRVIEELQSNRTESVHLFNALAKEVPEGVYLKTLKQVDRKLTIAGYAQANARVTTLMNNLDATELLENARLIETKAETVGGRRVNAFIIEIQIARKTADAKADAKGEAAAKPAKKS